jgi:hypothetical protein
MREIAHMLDQVLRRGNLREERLGQDSDARPELVALGLGLREKSRVDERVEEVIRRRERDGKRPGRVPRRAPGRVLSDIFEERGSPGDGLDAGGNRGHRISLSEFRSR